jgi:ABC-type bacteriocin/lantibiotic exporter with double-glycine peptidase domain
LKAAFKYLQEILTILGEDRHKVRWMILVFWVASLIDLAGLGLITPYIGLIISPDSVQGGKMVQVIDQFGLPHDQESLLVILGITLISVFLLKTISAIGINYIIISFSQNQQIHLSSLLMRAYQALPYTEYLRRNSSEYIYNIHVLVKHFAGAVVLSGLRTLSELIVTIMILGLLAWENVLALSMLLGLLIMMIFGYDRIFRKRLRYFGKQSNQMSTSLVQGIHEAIEGLKEIRVLGKEAHFHQKVHKLFYDLAHITRRSSLITMSPRYLLELVIIVFVVMFVTGTLFFTHNNMQSLFITLGVFGVATLRLVPATNTLISSLLQLRLQRNTVSRLYNDLLWIKKINLEAPTLICSSNPELFKNLTLQHVSFRYPSMNKDALNQISMEIRSGESIGLVGPSGSGKTTMVDVLLGMLKPHEGQIMFNGKPLDTSLAHWRQNVAYIPQQVFLIDSTLRCNVALWLSTNEIDDTRIEEALRKARLLEMVEQLPQGYDTMLGERGVRLSGGQRQRVALARAFYHERSVLVMDESTSALDNETEQEIVEEIKILKGNTTLVVIAHRMSTVQHCDRIYRLENGGIVESGTPEQVLNLKKVVVT